MELKGSVFKKFDKSNLFQVSCSDVRERLQLCVLLLVVLLQTMRELRWREDRFWALAPDCLLVLAFELVIDWLKHAFITRYVMVEYIIVSFNWVREFKCCRTVFKKFITRLHLIYNKNKTKNKKKVQFSQCRKHIYLF